MRRRSLLRMFATAPILAACATSVPPAPQPGLRALWVDGFHAGIRSRAECDLLISDARAAGIRMLLVQVRRRSDALFRASPEPVVAELEPRFDPLPYLCTLAHAQNPRIEIHAWLNALVAADEANMLQPGHLATSNGPAARGNAHWLSQTREGTVSQDKLVFFDPGREFGFNPTSVSRFLAGSSQAQPIATDPRWRQWRRDQVSALVRDIATQARAAKPWIKLSAALIPWGDGPVSRAGFANSAPYADVFQDWLAWLDEGLLDIAIPMQYDREADTRQRAWFDRWIAFHKQQRGTRTLLIGLGAFMNTMQETAEQARRAITPLPDGANAQGVCIYSYANAGLAGARLADVARALDATRA